MTNFPPYQSVVNENWKVAQAKFLYEIKLGKMLQPEPKASALERVPYLRAANVQWGDICKDDIAYMYASEEEIKGLAIENNDLLVCEGGEVGRAAVCNCALPEKTIIQNALHLVRPRKQSNSIYLYYYLRHIAESGWFDVICNKATIAHFTVEKFAELRIGYPSLPTQTKIANYLDSKTAELDQLIAAKKLLLTLLDEKKKALIARAVTRGLNPDVQLKASGIPWLGMIPEYWEVERSKWLLPEIDARSQSGTEELLSVSHLTGVTKRSEKNVNMFMAKSLEGYKKCEDGDLVINTLWAWMGAMGISPVSGVVSPAYNVYRPSEKLEPEYVDLLVRMPNFVAEITRYSKGVWSSRLRLYPEGLFETFLPVPPIAEQRQIINELKVQMEDYADLRTIAESTISLLQERRTALISAAVTGKLEEAYV